MGEVGEAEAGEAEARCLWCAGQNAESEGGERLLLCDGDEGHCFCAACVVHALGAKELQRVEQRSPWLCFKCASALKVAAAQCQALALLTARRLAALGSSAHAQGAAQPPASQPPPPGCLNTPPSKPLLSVRVGPAAPTACCPLQV